MPGDNNLHKAANKGDLDECKKYVEGIDGEDVIDVNEPGASDRRAIHRAAGAGHLEIVQYLLDKGATIDIVRSLFTLKKNLV
jgi:ankyrin repeat protein